MDERFNNTKSEENKKKNILVLIIILLILVIVVIVLAINVVMLKKYANERDDVFEENNKSSKIENEKNNDYIDDYNSKYERIYNSIKNAGYKVILSKNYVIIKSATDVFGFNFDEAVLESFFFSDLNEDDEDGVAENNISVSIDGSNPTIGITSDYTCMYVINSEYDLEKNIILSEDCTDEQIETLVSLNLLYDLVLKYGMNITKDELVYFAKEYYAKNKD